MARRSNLTSLSDEERDARRKADRDRLERAARALLTTEGWQRWIRVRATNGLSRYSLLILGSGCRRSSCAGVLRRRHVCHELRCGTGLARSGASDPNDDAALTSREFVPGEYDLVPGRGEQG
jgi:hypothetical protein